MTGPASLVSVSVRTAAAAAALLALGVALASCGDAEEDGAPAVTPTPTASGGSPPTATAPPTPVTATPAPVPSGWKEYVDTASGISFRYPPDLVVTDLTVSGPVGEMGERDFDVRSAQNKARAFAISIFESNAAGWSLDQFADELYCARDSREGSVAGVRAIACTREVVDGQPEASVVAQYGGRFIAITASPKVSEEEFATVIQGFMFSLE